MTDRPSELDLILDGIDDAFKEIITTHCKNAAADRSIRLDDRFKEAMTKRDLWKVAAKTVAG